MLGKGCYDFLKTVKGFAQISLPRREVEFHFVCLNHHLVYLTITIVVSIALKNINKIIVILLLVINVY